MKVLVTGAGGFLGWHTLCRLKALTNHQVVPVDRAAFSGLRGLLPGIDAIIHIAGVNRAQNPVEVRELNIALANQLSDAVVESGARPRIVFANSTQAENESPYGMGKRHSASILRELTERIGTDFRDVRLPNLFGEGGKPHYNSFVATFCDALVNERSVSVSSNDVRLLHAQDAARHLIESLTDAKDLRYPLGEPANVRDVFEELREIHARYQNGEVPFGGSPFGADLFNTLRETWFRSKGPFMLQQHSDARGTLVELVRSHGGEGQTFFSTSRPGVTRGDHFHLRKFERFILIQGEGVIRLRKLFATEVLEFGVSGSRPCAIDMPTMWAHNISNVGAGNACTVFWTNELYRPDLPDTYPELVGRGPK